MSASMEESTSKLILGSSNTSTEELVGEYEKLYSDKSKAKEFYLQVLIELEKAIVEGNLDRFKNLSSVIDCVTDLEDQVALQDYYGNISNPIRRTNLVILASKHNRVEILKYLFGSESKVLNSLSLGIGRDTISPRDADEERHNAFYYAIRSENTELLDVLIDEWPNNYFADRLEELDGLLSRAYGELKLKNVPLSVESELHVEKKLIDLRFFSNSSGQVQSLTNELDNIEKRSELLIESVRLLKRDYSGTEKVDGKFLFVAKSIAQNMNILKGQIKSTYDKLPWEELEFCLVVFVYSQAKTKPQALNLFYRCTLSKCKILNYLEDFANRLEEEKSNITGDKFHCFPTKQIVQKKTGKIIEVVKNREEVLESTYPQFAQLIDDFQQVRDLHSLQKIGDHIKWTLALASDASETEGKLLITRSLQVIGEHLKYTLESPKLSRSTGDLLVSLFPKNAKTIITNLRDSISHADSLSKRMEIENNLDGRFFINLQNEIKTVGGVITDILYKNKIKTIRMLLEKIVCSQDLADVTEILQELERLDIYESLAGNFKRIEHESLEKLIKKFSENISNKTNHEKELLKKITRIIDGGGTQSQSIITDYMNGYESLRTLSAVLGDNKIDDNLIKHIKRCAKMIIEMITPDVEPRSLIEIAKLSVQIFDSARPRIRDEQFEEVKILLRKICSFAQFGIGGIDSMERFRDKLKKNVSSHRRIKEQPECDNVQIGLQLTEMLKEILDKNQLNDPLYIISYKSNKKLQLAVEMLVLDIMSISESNLENNQLCLDDYSPLLIGKCLRNHLAHDNAVVDVLLTDRSRSVILNAKKLTQGSISGKNIGKLVHDDPIRLRDKYHQDLVTITNQENMFVALKEGNLESFEDCLRNGADIKARSINSWTTLHFAAVGSNLEIIKFLLDQGITVDVKDDNGQTPLHIAAAYGRQNIVAYFITEAGAHVDSPNHRDKTPLHCAAQNGHKDSVDVLVNNGADSAAHDKSGFSPLQYAISHQHINIAKILLKAGGEYAGINETVGGLTMLFKAAQYGQRELVDFLLENGADVNATNDEDNKMPLHVAALNGYPDVVKALIEKGANGNSKTTHDCTPVHFAALGRNTVVINILVDRGAVVNAVDKIGSTPLHYATGGAGGFEGNVTTLLEKNANPNLANEVGMTPLHFAANYNNLEIVAILCRQPDVDVNAKCKDGATPLHYAANCGHREVVAFLLEKGADVNAKNKKNVTALYASSLKGHTGVVDVLIENNAEVNVGDDAGYMPLHAAAKNGNKDVVELLVKKAEVNALCNNGYSALHLAVLDGHWDIVDLLLTNKAQVNIDGCEIDPFLMAAIYGGSKEIVESLLTNGAKHVIIGNSDFLRHAMSLNNKEVVEVLIANGADLREVGSEALLIAISRGHSDIVEILLRNSVNANKEDSLPISPLHLAAKMGYKRIVIALIGKGAQVDAKCNDNVTPLGLAALNGHEEIVKYLIERGGAKVNGESGTGPKPLHMAASKGHTNVIQILLDNGADVNCKDDKNRTPIELAASLGQLHVVIMLLEWGKTDINAKGNDEMTLLHYASLGNNVQLLEYLVKKGSDINAENSSGYKPIHVAAEEGSKNVVAFFLSKGMNVNDSVQDGGAMVHMAALNGHLEFANYLIAEGADVNPKDINGMTPMFFAAYRGYIGLVEIFLDKGVNIDSPDGPYNTTILHMAAVKGNLEFTHYLISRGADFNAKNSKGETPIELLLKNNGELNKTLLEMADNKDVSNLLESIKQLCNNSEEEEEAHSSRTKDITKDIYSAAKHGDIATVQRLLEAGADPNEKDVQGGALLHYAILFQHMDVVDILLEYGADVDQVTNTEKTPLHAATPESFEDTLINLMRHVSQAKLKEYINAKATSSGATSHQVPPKMSYWNITKSMLDQGAFPDVTDIKAKEMFENSKKQEVNDLLQLIGDLYG